MTARDDYPLVNNATASVWFDGEAQRALDEIDTLRAAKAQMEAACHNAGPGLFYDWELQRQGVRDKAIAKARAICNTCPASADCLNYALDTDQPNGIWAGHTPDERAALRRETRSA